MFYGFPSVKTVANGVAVSALAEHPVTHRTFSRNKKKAILKFCYFIGKNLSFLTRWFKKKKKWVQIWEKVKFIFDFRKWRSNFDFCRKWFQPLERSRKRLKKTYKVKFCCMQTRYSRCNGSNSSKTILTILLK